MIDDELVRGECRYYIIGFIKALNIVRRGKHKHEN